MGGANSCDIVLSLVLEAVLQIPQLWKILAMRVAVAGVLMLAAFNYFIMRPVTDGFHEGEYLGALWTMRSYFAGGTSFPLLVHGPMDFIPVLLAGALSDDQSTIILTRAINTLIAGFTWIVTLDILLTLLRRNDYRAAAGTVSVAMFLGMIAIIPADPVERQQTFLAIRDLFLVIGMWCTLRGLSLRLSLARHLLMILGGVAAAASLYWAYDRFLASVAFCGGLVLILLFQRAWAPIIMLIAGGIAGLLVIPIVAPTGGLTENFANLSYWLKYSGEVWHLSYLTRIPSLPTAIAMMALLIIFAKVWFEERRTRYNDAIAPFIAGLFALQFFFLLKYLNLPRQPNNYYFVWPFVLMLAGQTLRWPVWRAIDEALRAAWAAIVKKGLRQQIGLIAITLSLVVIVTNNMAYASLLNLRALVRPPLDADLLPPSVANATRGMTSRNGGCVLLWSNEGVFATALQKPFCTKYMYAVYASANHEADLLRQIQAKPPEIVILNSPFWSMEIYGRAMKQRLPAVDRFLRTHYRFSVRDGYAIGVRQINEPTSVKDLLD